MKKIVFCLGLCSLVFGKSYNLVDIYRLSFANSESYEIRKLQSDYNDKEVDKALSAFYPKVDATREYMKINEYPVVLDGIERERRNKRRDTTLTVEQTVYDRSKYLEHKLRKNDLLQSELDIEKEHQSLMNDVIKYYLDALLKAKQIELLSQKQKRLDIILQRAQVKYESGLISKADFLEAKLRHNELLTQTTKRELDYTISRSFLEKLSGTNDIEIKKHINLAFFDIRSLNRFNKDIEQNLDIKIQKIKLEKSDVKVSHSVSKFEPTVSLNYEHIEDDVPGTRNERTVSLLFKMNLFNGYYDSSNYQQARIEKTIEQLNYKKLYKEVDQALKNKVINLHSYFKIIQDYPEILDAKKFIVDGMQDRFNIGTKSLTDLLDEENEYFEKLNTYTEYQYQFLIEYADFIKYMNLLNEEFLSELDRLVNE